MNQENAEWAEYNLNGYIFDSSSNIILANIEGHWRDTKNDSAVKLSRYSAGRSRLTCIIFSTAAYKYNDAHSQSLDDSKIISY